MNQWAIKASALAVAAMLTACGGSGTVKPNFVNTGGATITARDGRSITFEEFISSNPITEIVEALNPSTRPTAFTSQTTATSITSLQYYIQSIELCESVTMNGTGYSDTSGCTYLYQNADAQDVSYYNTYTVTEAMADTTAGHFVDFMTAEGRASLSTGAAIDEGTYNYVLINFMRPIKIKGEFKLGGTTKAYTKTPSSVVAGTTDSAGRELEYTRIANSTTGSPELMTYMLNNGGTVVPLLKPFEVAADASVVLDFVFNPENFATASGQSSSCTGTTQAVLDEANCVSMDMPYAKMAPVPRLEAETTMKEVYLLDYVAAGAQKSKVRIELYYNSADTEKTIRGVDTAVVLDSTATEGSANTVQSYGVSETSSVVTLKGWNGTNLEGVSLKDLTRRTSGTAKLGCLFVGGPCTASDGSFLDKAYTYVGTAVVQ